MANEAMSSDAHDLHVRADAQYEAGHYEEALQGFRDALALDPGSAPLRFNIGNALRHLKRFREAVDAYDGALAIAPAFGMAHHNKATCLLHMGDLENGFREYEWRKISPGFADDARYRWERPWRGEDLRGKRLFIYPELFQGDLLQFGRYALLAQRCGAEVFLGAPESMRALLRTVSSTINVVDGDTMPDGYDVQCALMTLPALFGTTLQNVPPPMGFTPEPERVRRWRVRIGSHGFRIGIAWQGSALAAQRSYPLADAVRSLAGLPGVRLISLQKHNGLEQLNSESAKAVETLGDDFDPGPDAFLDTAAAMTCCDLFITSDTSVLHLAGGLDVPTWLALHHAGDWRWLDGRSDTPWYPNVRLFRQPSPGDWPAVFRQMADRLSSHLGSAR